VEFLSAGDSQIFFECVDYDKDAIEYSYNKIKEKGFLNNVEFFAKTHSNSNRPESMI